MKIDNTAWRFQIILYCKCPYVWPHMQLFEIEKSQMYIYICWSLEQFFLNSLFQNRICLIMSSKVTKIKCNNTCNWWFALQSLVTREIFAYLFIWYSYIYFVENVAKFTTTYVAMYGYSKSVQLTCMHQQTTITYHTLSTYAHYPQKL